MRRLLPWVAIGVLALAAAGCATMNVGSHMQRGLDFTQYRTYDWGPADALPTGDARLDNPFFRDYMEGAVEKQLAAKGLERASADAPDLLIHYHAVVQPRIDVNRADGEYGYCYDETCGVRVIDVEAGTLVVDVVDARTNKLIWRGWAQSPAQRLLSRQHRMARTIDEAVRRMLARFPEGAN